MSHLISGPCPFLGTKPVHGLTLNSTANIWKFEGKSCVLRSGNFWGHLSNDKPFRPIQTLTLFRSFTLFLLNSPCAAYLTGYTWRIRNFLVQMINDSSADSSGLWLHDIKIGWSICSQGNSLPVKITLKLKESVKIEAIVKKTWRVKQNFKNKFPQLFVGDNYEKHLVKLLAKVFLV